MKRKAPFIGKIPTEKDWTLIRDEFVRTDITIKDLALKYGLGQSVMFARKKKENWTEERASWRVSICAQSGEIIRRQQIEDHVRVYDATREVVDLFVASAKRFAQDRDGLFKHLIQRETSQQDGSARATEKWAEEMTFTMLNGKNFADAAKGLKDLSLIARTLDGILDAKDRANIDLQRDKLELDRKVRGMDSDTESESGIAYMPVRDNTLLEGALPDPGDSVQSAGDAK
jgi:hypothetical protein